MGPLCGAEMSMQSCSVPRHQHHSHVSQDGHAGDKKSLSCGQTITPLGTSDCCTLGRP